MSPPESPRMPGWLSRAGVIAFWTVLAAVALVVVLRIALAGPLGRWAVMTAVDGRSVDGVGVISLTELDGDVLHDFTISRLALTGPDGEWLVVQDAAVTWRARSLLTGGLWVEAVSVDAIRVLDTPPERAARTPSDTPRQRTRPRRWPNIHLGSAVINALTVDPSLAPGAPPPLRIGAQIRAGPARGLALDLQAQSAPSGSNLGAKSADDAEILVRAEPGAPLSIRMRLKSDPGGVIASLLRLDQVLTVALDAQGAQAGGDVAAKIAFGDAPAADITGRWSAERYTIAADITPSAAPWPLAADLLGTTASLSVGGEFAGEGPLASANLNDGEAALTLQRSDEANAAWRLTSEVRGALIERTAAAFLGGQVGADGAELAAEYRPGETAQASATLRVLQPQGPGLSAAGLTATLTADDLDGGGVAEARLDIDAFASSDPRLTALLGANPVLTAAGSRADARNTWSLDRARLVGDGVEITAAGELDASDGPVWRAEAEGDVLDLSLVAPMLQGAGRVIMTANGAPDGLSADIQAQADAGDNDALMTGVFAELLGARVEARAKARRDVAGRITVDDAEIRAAGGVLTGQARFVDVANVSLSAQATVNSVTLGAAEFAQGAQADVALIPSEEGLSAVLTTTVPLLTGPADLAVSDGQLRIEADDLNAAAQVRAVFEGQTSVGRADVTLTADRLGTGWRAALTNAAIGPYTVTGGADIAAQSASGQIEITAPDRSRPILTATGRLIDDVIQADAVLAGLASVDFALDQASLSVDGSLGDLTLRAAITGDAAAPVSLTVNADLAQTPDVALTAAISGALGDYPITTAEPVRLTQAGGVVNAVGALGLGQGRVTLAATARSRDDIALNADWRDAPLDLAAVFRPNINLTGASTGTLQLRSSPQAGWTGALSSTTQFAPASPSALLAPHVLSAAATLDAGSLSASINLDGPELTGVVDGAIGVGLIRQVADLRREDAPVTASARLDGGLAPLIAIAGLERARTLEGRISARAALAGVLGAPDFTGQAELTEGRFDDPSIGVGLRDIAAEATFSGDGLDLTQLTARGRDGGTLSAEGRISLANARPRGRIRAVFDDLAALDRADLAVIATGTAAVDLVEGGAKVVGAARIDRAEVRPPDGGGDGIVELDVEERGGPSRPAPPRRTRRDPFTITLNYQITAPARVFVRTAQIDTEWALDLDIQGALQGIAILGSASLLRGEANLAGARFAFDSGAIDFVGPPADARMDIRALRVTPDLDVEVRVAGSLTAPELTLTSTPSLPEEEILARLLFGGSAAELSPLQAAQLGALAAGGQGGAVFATFDEVRAALGVDRLAVNTNPDGAAVVTGGRYIGDDLYVEVETRPDGEGVVTRLEWRLDKRWTVLSRLVGSEDAGLSLTWRREY